MSDRLPYEEQLQQQWNDLPLPDENKAWEDMKRRLEEDDDDGVIVWWRRGCMLWGLLLLVVFGLGIWFWKKDKWFTGSSQKSEIVRVEENDSTGEAKRIIEEKVKLTDEETIRVKENKEELQEEEKGKQVQKELTVTQVGEDIVPEKNKKIDRTKMDIDKVGETKIPDDRNKIKEKNVPVAKTSSGDPVVIKRNSGLPGSTIKISSGVTKTQTKIPNKPQSKSKQPISKKEVVTNTNKSGKPSVVIATDKPVSIPIIDSSKKTSDVPVTIANDSIVAKKKPDSTQKKPAIKESSLATNEAKKDSSKKKPVFFSAGIAMQQLLPVAGQKSTPYNALGRKGTLADYIPSVYFRVNKKDKWFVQGEFRYGAPQYTKEIVYNQQVKLDTIGTNDFTTRSSNTLKKTYYHQLPVSFNYFVMPDWSIGAGFSWNKFISAISDREVISRDNTTSIDTVIVKGIVRNKEDSAFAKSYFQGIFETQYKWKRFSFGARYAFGLQPYIKFKLITGEQRQERSSSLQVFLRYELWKSKE